MLETLQLRKEELDKKYKDVEEFHSSYDMFLKVQMEVAFTHDSCVFTGQQQPI